MTFHLGTTATSIDERSVTLEERRKPPGRSRRRRHRRAAGDLAWRNRQGSPSIAASPWTSTSRRASRASSRPATSRAGRTGSPASASASNTGSWPSARGRLRRATSSVGANGLTPSRSSGPSSTISASPMSVTPKRWDKAEIDGQLESERLHDHLSTRGQEAGRRRRSPRSRRPARRRCEFETEQGRHGD